MEHQALGQWDNCPIDPAYYIDDCRIFDLIINNHSQLLCQVTRTLVVFKWLQIRLLSIFLFSMRTDKSKINIFELLTMLYALLYVCSTNFVLTYKVLISSRKRNNFQQMWSNNTLATQNFDLLESETTFMRGSSHIRSVEISVKPPQIFRWTLDVYLLLFFSADHPHSEWSVKTILFWYWYLVKY